MSIRQQALQVRGVYRQTYSHANHSHTQSHAQSHTHRRVQAYARYNRKPLSHTITCTITHTHIDACVYVCVFDHPTCCARCAFISDTPKFGCGFMGRMRANCQLITSPLMLTVCPQLLVDLSSSTAAPVVHVLAPEDLPAPIADPPVLTPEYCSVSAAIAASRNRVPGFLSPGECREARRGMWTVESCAQGVICQRAMR